MRDEGGCPLQLDVGRSALSVGRLFEDSSVLGLLTSDVCLPIGNGSRWNDCGVCFWNDFTKLRPDAGLATTRPSRKFGLGANVAIGSGTYSPKSKASGVRRRRGPTPCKISTRLVLTCAIQSCVSAMKKSSLRLATSFRAGSAWKISWVAGPTP